MSAAKAAADTKKLANNVTINENSVIGAGSVIGSEGFGFQRDKASIQRFIHIGGVKIGKNVRIGSNNSIDRGALEKTLFGANKGTSYRIGKMGCS